MIRFEQSIFNLIILDRQIQSLIQEGTVHSRGVRDVKVLPQVQEAAGVALMPGCYGHVDNQFYLKSILEG